MGFFSFMNSIGNVFRSIGSIGSTVTNIINSVKTLIRCLMAFFTFISVFFSYCGNFTIWIFTYLLPWVGQYLECAFQKIISLPKCFFWYSLDCIAWVFYLPFRMLFWSLGMEEFIHDYFWCLLEDMDKFIHDEDGLNTGVHIIHFPDSVMNKCYYCDIKPIKKKMPTTCNLTKKYKLFINCRNSNDLKKCSSAKIDDFFEQPDEDKTSSANFD